MAAGFGVPRPTIGLYPDGAVTRLQINPGQSDEQDASADLRPKLIQASEPFLSEAVSLDGYVFMQRSPSCALGSAPAQGLSSATEQDALNGVFAEELIRRRALLPVAQEIDLQRPRILDQFLGAVFAHCRLREAFETKSFSALLDFHGRYKYQLMAHSVPAYNYLGRLLATYNKDDFSSQQATYYQVFMKALNASPSKGGEINALMHMMGYIKTQLSAEQRRHLLQRMEDYRHGILPLQTIVCELQNYTECWGSDYIRRQYYWQPHPLSQSLRAQLS
ncbi:DUF523 and DUF1722 domain-containing protein [Pseudoteredinibacter isoporae]